MQKGAIAHMGGGTFFDLLLDEIFIAESQGLCIVTMLQGGAFILKINFSLSS